MLEVFRSLTCILMLAGMAIYLAGYSLVIIELSFEPKWTKKIWPYANYAGKILRYLIVVMLSATAVSVILFAINGTLSTLWLRYWLAETPFMLTVATWPVWPELIDKLIAKNKKPKILPMLTS